MINMEPSNQKLSRIYSNNDINKTNFNNMVLFHQQVNMTNKINNFPNPNDRPRSPITIGLNNRNNNVQLNPGKKNSNKNQINDNYNILNDQNINILNMNLIPRNTNQPSGIFVQKLLDNDLNYQKYFHHNLTENNAKICNNNYNEEQKQKENKGKQINYQYIVKNVKKDNHISITKAKEFNDLTNNLKKNEEEMNINQIREELRLIYDNRKYNYDHKVQRINPKKIPAPQSKKIVERLLEKNWEKENKEEYKKMNEYQPYSKFDVQTLPEYKISYELGIKPTEINNINQNNNIHHDVIFQKDKQKMNLENNINHLNIGNPYNLRYVQPQYQKNDQNNLYTVHNNNQIIEKNKFITQQNSLLMPSEYNNKESQKQVQIHTPQKANNSTQPPLALVKKLDHININNNDNSRVCQNIKPVNNQKINVENNLQYNQLYYNNNISFNRPNQNMSLFQPQNNNQSDNNDINIEEPKNTDEFNNDDSQNENSNINIPKYINIKVKKITPILRDLGNNNTQLVRQNLNITHNIDIIQNNSNNMDIKQNQTKEIIQQQKAFINPQQNLQNTEKMNNLNKIIITNTNTNVQKDINTKENSNCMILNQNLQVTNNVIHHKMNTKEDINQSIIQSNNQQNITEINNKQMNINQNQKHQTLLSNPQQIQLQQIPNNTIIGNILIKDGKAYYLNPIPNPNLNINQNINIINKTENYNQQVNIVNNKIPNQPNLQNNFVIKNNNMITNNQNMNNKIIYKDQNVNIINNQKNLQQQKPVQQPNNQPKLRNCKNTLKRKRLSRVARLLQEKAPKENKQAIQYQVERNRPVYAVPPSKKRSVSQGKPFTLINKYYDENYILEDDKEEDDKNEEINNIHVEKNMSDEDDYEDNCSN